MGGAPSRDLLLVAIASLASIGLMALPVDGLVKGLLLVPAVLVLPGYAISRAMFPFGRLPGEERLVYTFVLSVAAAALGGLAWQLAFDLSRFSWASLLTAITLVSCGVAQARRARGGERPDPTRAEPRMPRPDVPTAIAVLAAVAIAVVAVAVAADGLREERAKAHFSSLWIVSHGAADGVEIGIWNHQGAPHRYRLRVTANGRTIEDWRGPLGSHQSKQLALAPPAFQPGARVVVSLYRDGVLYRRTELDTGGGT
jgi:hypothetical protein